MSCISKASQYGSKNKPKNQKKKFHFYSSRKTIIMAKTRSSRINFFFKIIQYILFPLRKDDFQSNNIPIEGNQGASTCYANKYVDDDRFY